MAAFNKFNQFVEDLGNGVHNLSSDTIMLALTNSAPVATNTVKANITEIAYTNVSGGQPTLGSVSFTETSGTATLDAADEVITASGGSVGPFRYIVLYNDTPTSPADPLIGWYDYGSGLTLADSESLTVQFDGSNGILTLA